MCSVDDEVSPLERIEGALSAVVAAVEEEIEKGKRLGHGQRACQYRIWLSSAREDLVEAQRDVFYARNKLLIAP